MSVGVGSWPLFWIGYLGRSLGCLGLSVVIEEFFFTQRSALGFKYSSMSIGIGFVLVIVGFLSLRIGG